MLKLAVRGKELDLTAPVVMSGTLEERGPALKELDRLRRLGAFASELLGVPLVDAGARTHPPKPAPG